MPELKIILQLEFDESYLRNKLKTQLVKHASNVYDHGSQTEWTKATLPPLKVIAGTHIKKWKIQAINVAYAKLTFPDAFATWEKENHVNYKWNLETDCGDRIQIPLSHFT